MCTSPLRKITPARRDCLLNRESALNRFALLQHALDQIEQALLAAREQVPLFDDRRVRQHLPKSRSQLAKLQALVSRPECLSQSA